MYLNMNSLDEESKMLILLSMVDLSQFLGKFIGYDPNSPAGHFYNDIRNQFNLSPREDAIGRRLIAKEGEEITKHSINLFVFRALAKRVKTREQKECFRYIINTFAEKWFEHPEANPFLYSLLEEYVKSAAIIVYNK